ncbi:MAG: cyclic nucleotide-binding domain-containing protein [Calditrichaceae bacterium]|nr:cyclic nucleotide-binding domain-containing protein [Calditrichaceae bacterium]MBN2707947.1 cyclic nucleotide-binding domain-containing protein [Calditrichaceae bacterium]RQV95951.1 MAG: cyclic nucleotide-binding domain-containing protein [Calditrichota bacterium]
MTEDPLWSNIFKRQKTEKEDIFTVMRKVPIFSSLDSKELRAVEHILHHRTYEQDEVIFKQGEPGLGMYIIESGSVRIALGEKQKLLALLSRGDFFGEMALLLEAPRTAGAVAAAPTKLLGFFQPDLFDLMSARPETGNKVLIRLSQMIAERLKQTSIENQHLRTKLNELEDKSAHRKKIS